MGRFIPVEPEKWGEMVQAWAENPKLKAEVERLTAFTTRTIIPNEELQAENARLKAEVERLRIAGSESEPRFVLLSDYRHLKAETDNLKAEVERLTKAGDTMASSIQFNEEMAKDYNGPTIVHQSVQRWNAAKEGKQP
jgi:cell division septum initiation protein DivIVA